MLRSKLTGLGRRIVPGLDDALLVPGAIGVSVSVAGLTGFYWGLLVLSVLALAGGILVARSGPGAP